jgi:hypothetical protein
MFFLCLSNKKAAPIAGVSVLGLPVKKAPSLAASEHAQ